MSDKAFALLTVAIFIAALAGINAYWHSYSECTNQGGTLVKAPTGYTCLLGAK